MYDNSYDHKIQKTHIWPVSVLLVSLLTVGIVIGGVFVYSNTSYVIQDLNQQIADIYRQNENIASTQIEYYIDGTSLSDVYDQVKDSIVVITGVVGYQSFFRVIYTTVQGSGFVCEIDDMFYVVTNNHVIEGATDLVVTFSNGNAYEAQCIGSDIYTDLAVLQVSAPDYEYKALSIVSSSNLKVGDPVVAIGAPRGLDSTMTTGIISQLGRTLEETLAGSFPIANIIQTNVAINPGNSGGPLLNYYGEVIGVTTAIIEDSEGLGFVIPSDTILKEIRSLITQGSFTNHSWLGISGIDMTYTIAKEIDADVTYGWLVTYVSENSAASQAGVQGGIQQKVIMNEYVVVGGDIIIAIDGSRVVNGDYLLSYLASETCPGQIVTVTLLRENTMLNVPIELGRRPVVS